MLSVSPNSITRSSLEEMLDSLRRRDENDKPKDMPPALPSRPRATSRARLPSVKRPLPSGFEADTEDLNSNNIRMEDKNAKGIKGNSFGNKKAKEMEPHESPYVKATEGKECQQRLEKDNGSNVAGSAHSCKPRFRESDWDDNIGYFIKKVKKFMCFLLY